jgi:putative FmdB family regulatory protein
VPTYQYACTDCDHRFEAVQSFSDDALTVCPNCSGKLRKVFSSVGIVFKGSGFYRTDSRNGSSATAAPAKGEGGSTKTESGSSGDSSSSSNGSSSSGSSDSGSSKSGSSKTGSSKASSGSAPAAAAS